MSVILHAHARILHQCDGVKDHTTRGLKKKTLTVVLFKGCAGTKRGAPCCAVNHSLCVLGAVGRALVLRQTGHTLLSGEGDRIALVTESSGDLSPYRACYSGF